MTVYDVCASGVPSSSPALGRVDRTRMQLVRDLCIGLLKPPVALVAESEAGDQICVLFGDDSPAYVERALRLSTGLSSVGSCGTSPCNPRRHLRGGEKGGSRLLWVSDRSASAWRTVASCTSHLVKLRCEGARLTCFVRLLPPPRPFACPPLPTTFVVASSAILCHPACVAHFQTTISLRILAGNAVVHISAAQARLLTETSLA